MMNSKSQGKWKREIKLLMKNAGIAIRNRGTRIFSLAQTADLAPIQLLDDPNTGGYSFLVPSERKQDYYKVLAYLPENDLIINCTCPLLADFVDPCKHMVAAMIFLDDSPKLKVQNPASQLTVASKVKTAFKSDQQPFIYPDSIVRKKLLNQLVPEINWNANHYAFNRHRWPSITKDIKQKSLSARLHYAFDTSITHTSDHQLTFNCTCPEMDSRIPCKHIQSLIYLIVHSNLDGFFRPFDDLRSEKAALLAKYDIKPEDELASDFLFGFDWEGHLVVCKEPAHLYLPQQTDKWMDLKQSMSIAQSFKASKIIENKETFDQVQLYLQLTPDKIPYIEFKLLFSRAKKTGPGQIHKVLSIRKSKSLALLGDMKPEWLDWLEPLNLEQIDAQSPYWQNRFEHLKGQILADYILRVRHLLHRLANDPGAPEVVIDDDTKNYQIIHFKNNQPQFKLKLDKQGNYFTLSAWMKESTDASEWLPLKQFVYFPWCLMVKGQDVYQIDQQHVALVQQFCNHPLYFPTGLLAKVQEELLTPLEATIQIEYDSQLKPRHTDFSKISPLLRIELGELGNDYLLFTPTWDYDGTIIEYAGEKLKLADGSMMIVKRNHEEEEHLKAWLRQLHPAFQKDERGFFHLTIKEGLANNCFFNFIQQANERGIQLLGKEALKHFNFNESLPEMKIKVSGTIDWFDVSMEAVYGEQTITLSELKKAMLADQTFVTLPDGSLGHIPKEWETEFGYLLKSGEMKKNSLTISKFQWPLIDALKNKEMDRSIEKEIVRKKKLLSDFSKETKHKVPAKIKATLRDYQLAGFQWLCTLHQLEWGACLADDMGLGKTLQTLTFLVYINKKIKSTHLIVCPTSLIYNWESEIQKFCPQLRYTIHYGISRDKQEDVFKDIDIVLTSYGTLRSDIEWFRKFKFGYVILDESHAIKNPASQIAHAVKLLNATNRLALSGTPLQNNTLDIYSQMNFLNPGMLGSLDHFRKEFSTPIDKQEDAAKAELLRKLLYPFMLRRTKEQVAKDLPAKTETVLWCEMDKPQREIYDAFKNHYRDLVMKKIDQEGMNKSGFMILEALLKLRQICNSPAILNEDIAYPNHSVKLDELTRELQENTGEHKVLIFSQFVTMLKLIEHELVKGELDYIYLDGQTKASERKQKVNEFQESKNIRIMLISLKAGGVGLNLTEADYVYLIDPWWNPAVEQQAIDRTHRIGQKRSVFAYKMICKDSIEEKIMQLQQKKLNISSELIKTEASFMKQLTRDDVKYLFS